MTAIQEKPAEVQAQASPPNIEAERQLRKQQLAVAYRLFAEYGFASGSAGHITARDPGDPECFWVTPISKSFAHMTPKDLLLVSWDGRVLEGDGEVNAAGFAIHSKIHAARPDVVAAAHAHTLAGRAWSTLGRLLDPLTQDACAFYQDHALFDDFTGVVLDLNESQRIADALGDTKAVIMKNHGLLAVGDSVAAAAWWFIAFDQACDVQLRAEAAGMPQPMDAETATMTAGQIGTTKVAHSQWQPLWEDMITRHPEVLG